MYSLEEVFNQSNEDRYAARLNGVGYISNTLYGVKIIRDNITSDVEILHAQFSEGYYAELTEDQVKIFLDNGWRYGVFVVALSNYCLKLDSIENKIKDAMSRRGSKKLVQMLKDRRDEVLKKYTEINNKLNKIKNDNN
jgi:sRNA-binding regulator protein Hfq|tara:strand:+ start:273 stop:686 length:414 start_codon:yes stop_codon:yes gene_type:complete